jgi:hypothetical protein
MTNTAMRLPKVLLIVGVVTFVVIGSCILSIFVNRRREQQLRVQQREALAQQLGVEIVDFPSETLFPAGYLEAVLKPGASVEEVHRIVQGYELALVCQDDAEVYYFYRKDDFEAVRIQLLYDDDKRFYELRTEDNDSMTIYTGNCEVGQLSE